MGRIIVLVMLLTLLATGAFATKFMGGETVPIHTVLIDSLTGQPTAPDTGLPRITIYSGSSTTAVRARVAMTQWNTKTGQYYYDFVIPEDTIAIYTAYIEQFVQGKIFIIKRIIPVELYDNFSIPELMATDVSGEATLGAFGERVNISGDSSLWASAKTVAELAWADTVVALADRKAALSLSNSDTAFDRIYDIIKGDTALMTYMLNKFLDSVKKSTGSSAVSGLILNGTFDEQDSVYSTTMPKNWLQGGNATFTACKLVTSGVGGKFDYRLVASGADTLYIYQRIGTLQAGYYNLSASFRCNGSGSTAILFLSQTLNDLGINPSGFFDSLITTSTVMYKYSKIVYLDSGNYQIGCFLSADGVNDYADFDNIELSPLGPITTFSAGSAATLINAMIDSGIVTYSGGADKTFVLGGLEVIATVDGHNAVTFRGRTTGSGLYAEGGNYGHGIVGQGGEDGGDGIAGISSGVACSGISGLGYFGMNLDGSNTGLFAWGSGATGIGIGAYGLGYGARIYGTGASAGIGLSVEGTGTAGYGLRAYNVLGHAVDLSTHGASYYGIYSGATSALQQRLTNGLLKINDTLLSGNTVGNFKYTATDSGLNIKRVNISGANGSTFSLNIANTNGAAARIIASGGSAVDDNYYGLGIFGNQAGSGLRLQGGVNGNGGNFVGGSTSGHGLQTIAYGANSYGFYPYSTLSYGMRARSVVGSNGISGGLDRVDTVNLSGAVTATIDMAVLMDSLRANDSIFGGTASIDVTSLLDSLNFYGYTPTDGRGDASLKLWVIDTSANPDVKVDNAYLTVSPLRGTGRSWSWGTTGSVGYLSGNLNYGDSVIERFFLPGYTAPDSPDTAYVNDSTFEDTIFVYKDTATYTCIIWGQAKDYSGSILRNTELTFELTTPTKSSCDSTLFIPSKIKVKTNPTGWFSTPLTWSACLNNAEYIMKSTYGNMTPRRITVLSQVSQRIN